MIKNLPIVRLMLVAVFFCASLTTALAQDVNVQRNEKDNSVSTIVFTEGSALSIDAAAKKLPSYYELDDSSEFKQAFVQQPSEGVEVARYNQWYLGIPVEHGSVTMMSKDGRVTFMNGDVYKPVTAPSTIPVLSEQQALTKAMSAVGASEYAWEQVQDKTNKIVSLIGDNAKPEGTLVWVQDYNYVDELSRERKLAYKFDIYATKPLSRNYVYVDAQDGTVLLKDAIIKHVGATGTAVYSGNVAFETSLLSPNNYSLEDQGRNVYTYDMQSSTNPSNAVDFINSNTTWAKSYAIDAHWGTSLVFDYWKNEHNRISYDGAGSNLISLLNYDNNFNNAFWSGTVMVYGSGTGMFNGGFEPLMALDVCGHELGHGICEYTSGLVYALESGAMNEGFSDIWGAVIENYSGKSKQTWTIGEELRVGALRSMSNPNLFGDPDCYGGLNWVNVLGCSPHSGNDQCGVHTNSGVLNYWFYLLTEGGKGTNDMSNDFEVSGIGIEKAAKIAYQTELVLTSTATYANCRTASINVATSLYGSCSREVEAVTRAWHAVGVGAAFSPCTPQIGFGISETVVNKISTGTSCPSDKTIDIPVRVIGGGPVGGNATVTVTGTGTAINGADYLVVNNPLTFNSGSTATQNLQVQIFDNADINSDKTLKLHIAVTPNGSNANVSYTYDTCVVTIRGFKEQPGDGNDIVRRIHKADLKSKAVTPFFSRNRNARTQFIITAEELRAAGVNPNQPIKGISFNVTEKNSTQPFSNFNLKVEQTAIADLTSANPIVNTTYYSGSYTTKLGLNIVPFSTDLTWNGTSNLAIETCFSNASFDSENDYIEAVGTNVPITGFVSSNSGGSGCGLSFGFGFESNQKPAVLLVQGTDSVEVETTINNSRDWDVNDGQENYFYNDANGKLIGAIDNADMKMGCTKVGITAQGNGIAALPAPYNATSRTVKEFTVVATSNIASVGYDVTLYFDQSELSGVNLSDVRMVATTAASDSLMLSTNTTLAVPAQTMAGNRIGYTASFKGVSTRYFLVDKNFKLEEPDNISGLVANSGAIRVDNNPFTDKIYVSYSFQKDKIASIRMYDITGKTVYSSEKALAGKGSRFSIDVNNSSLVPGTYILQIVTDTDMLTQKMIKQ